MKRLLRVMLVGAILCILLAFVLLVVFKVSGFTGVAAAYVVGGSTAYLCDASEVNNIGYYAMDATIYRISHYWRNGTAAV